MVWENKITILEYHAFLNTHVASFVFYMGIFATGHHENAYFAATHRQRHRLLSTIMNSIMFATAHRDHYFNDFQSLGERNLLK